MDQDARVGRKSKTEHFFGYKTEYAMTTEERVITAVRVNDGAYVDGTQFHELMDLTKECGVTIEEIFGDRAYFKKPILDKIKELEATAYIPVNAMAYRVDEDLFSYDKDSDEWFCEQGNKTERKKYSKDKRGRESYKYYFEKEKCRNCPLRDECIKEKRIGKILVVGINAPVKHASEAWGRFSCFQYN